MTKGGYKLQEFVAHGSNVNCLNIGKKSSRLLVTGGEDQKVNLWAIGKPTSLLSLSGHTSPVESVTFDSGEVLVASGASFGVIKLWDLEEAKVLRTLTGHRSSCNALQFHPFGEFFASGSSDTSLKVWDVRKKGCIHTYKGHTRGVSTIKFTPDGRWVVSGGADNVVKIWDLTAGKLLHEFKFHEGQIQCIEFHPLEFLLATGSADKTVKFWDLETFEMIGSAGPEATGVRAMAFHPDGKRLFSGLEDSLKVFSWEPIICHDSVDMGWSTLGDLSINEGKLLGCSYYHNCVGVWAADISMFGSYVAGVPPQSSGRMQHKFDIQEHHAPQEVGNTRNSITAVPIDPQETETPEIRNIYMDTCGNNKITPQRMGSINSSNVALSLDSSETSIPAMKRSIEMEVHNRSSSHMVDRQVTVPLIVPRNNPNAEKIAPNRMGSMNSSNMGLSVDLSENSIPVDSSENGIPAMLKRSVKREVHSRSSSPMVDRQVIVPLVVPRDNPNAEKVASLRKEVMTTETTAHGMMLKPSHMRRTSNAKYEPEKLVTNESGRFSSKLGGLSISSDPNCHSRVLPKVESKETVEDSHKETSVAENFEKNLLPQVLLKSNHDSDANSQSSNREISSSRKINKALIGRTRSLVERWERREPCQINESPTIIAPASLVSENLDSPQLPSNMEQKEQPQTSGRDETVLEDLMRNHETFTSSFHSRLAKLQVVRYFWQRNDLKGGLNAVGKLPDHSVQADVVSVLIEKMDIVSLELFSCLLPMLLGLLNSQTDRHTSVSLEMLLKLVAIFGPVIRSTISASPSIGVDLQAERRRECCQHCFVQLQKIKQIIPSIIRRGGVLARYAQELSLLQES